MQHTIEMKLAIPRWPDCRCGGDMVPVLDAKHDESDSDSHFLNISVANCKWVCCSCGREIPEPAQGDE